MQYVPRTVCALLVAAPLICAADAEHSGSETAASAQQSVTHTAAWTRGLTLTAPHKPLLREQVGRVESAILDAQTLPVVARATQLSQSAPLLPPIWVDDETAIEAIAVGDVTGDSRADVIAFGSRASPNQSQHQLSIYAQTPQGVLAEPIHSAVTSQTSVRPGGLVVRPIFGARPDVVAWGSFWIEIYSVAADGTTLPTPVTIAPGLGILDVVIADLNADGRPDFIVSGTDSNDVNLRTRVRRYLQTAAKTFTPDSAVVLPLTENGVDGVLADVDGDGVVDAINGVRGTSFGFEYWPGHADGTFGAPVSVLETAANFTQVTRVSVRDLDGNGLADVVLAMQTGARVRFQTAPGTFTTADLAAAGSMMNVFQVTIGDLDGNGLLDAVMWMDGYNLMQVALQTAPRVFAAAGQYAVPNANTYASFYENTTSIADVNSDAKPDLLVVTAGLVAFYNSLGSYPVLDARVTSTGQADDSGPTAYVLWQHQVANAGPATLTDSLLLQNIPEGYELSGTNVPCAYFVTLIACELPPVAAGSSTTVSIEAKSVLARSQDGIARVEALISVGGQPIDTVPDNNSAQVATPVRGHPEALQAAADEVFVYEGAGDAVIPVINTPGTSLLERCMSYTFSGANASDGTGIAGDTNGNVCTAPGQRGQARIRVGVRDGTTANAALKFNLAFSTGGFSAPGTQTLTIVDDDDGSPKLASSGAQPFDVWPAVFSSISTVHSRTGADAASPRAVAIGDLDGDGRNDLAVSFSDMGVQPSYVLVWLQQPNGALNATPLKWNASFSGAIASLAIGDVIGDGAAELVVPLYDELDLLRVVNGQLQLVSATVADAWKVAVSDLNGDGYADVVAANAEIQSFDGPQYWVPNVTVYRGNAQRTLDSTPYKFAMPYAGRNELVIGRFNDDTLPDIAISSGQGNFPSVSIAYQNQDGTFAAPVGIWVAGPMHLDGLGFGDSVTTGDFNGDHKTDLAIGSYVGDGVPSVWIYTDLRDDDFSYPSQRLYGGPEGSLGALDVDHDGKEDLLVDNAVFSTSPGIPIKVFMQDAARQLRYAGTLASEGSGRFDPWIQKIAVGNLDGDAEKDAAIINYYSAVVYLARSAATNQSVQITTLESSSQVAAGVSARYRVRIANGGARRSLEMPLNWSLPAQLGAPQIVAAKGGCYVAASTAQCLLPQIDSGGFVDVMLSGTFTASGTYPMSISVGPGGAYGSSTLSATVSPAGSGGSSGGGTGGSTSSGGGGGGGGAVGWLGALALFGAVLRRRQWHRPSPHYVRGAVWRWPHPTAGSAAIARRTT